MVDFHGEKRSNQTHESKTDPDAKLARKAKGKEAKLSYSGNLLVENRNGRIVNAELLEANGREERDAALVMLEHIPDNGRITGGGDKAAAPSMRVPLGTPVIPRVKRNANGSRSVLAG